MTTAQAAAMPEQPMSDRPMASAAKDLARMVGDASGNPDEGWGMWHDWLMVVFRELAAENARLRAQLQCVGHLRAYVDTFTCPDEYTALEADLMGLKSD